MNAFRFVSCSCLVATSLAAQNYLAMPVTAAPSTDLPGYSLAPLMQPNSRVQMFFDATEVGASSFTADEISFRYDGPIPQVGAPGPFSITRMKIDIGVTTVPFPGATFAANLTQPLTTVLDGPWSYYPDPGFANPHPWGAPNGSLTFPFATPVAVTIPTGAWLVVDVTMEGNNIASFGFSHAILDGATTTGGIGNGAAITFGQGCSAGAGPTATITSSGIYAPGAAHFLAGQNLGANALALTIFGVNNPAATLPGTACTIFTDPIVYQLVVTDAAGSFGSNQAGAALSLAADNSLANLVVYEQAVSLVPTANAWGLVASNGVEVTLGVLAPLGRGTYTVQHDTDAAATYANSVKAFGFATRLRTL